MPWQFLYAEEDVWKAFTDEYPGMTWLATVVYQRRMLGEIHIGWLDDGRFVYVPAWYGSKAGCAETGSNRPELGSPEAAALVILCCEAGTDLATAVDEEYRLRHLSTAALRQELSARDGWACHLCGKPIPRRLRSAAHAGSDPLSPDVEHIVPIKSGGPHWWSNLCLAHHACNLASGGRNEPYEPATTASLRVWLHDHPKARPCPLDSVDPAHFDADGTCKCQRAEGDGRKRDHRSDAGEREMRQRFARELATV